MPYLRCPNCGNITHVRVADLEAFYEKHGRPNANRFSEGLCFFCWKELKVSDLVEVIKVSDLTPSVRVGSRGRVTEIVQEQLVYEVVAVQEPLQRKWAGRFRRDEIKFVYDRSNST